MPAGVGPFEADLAALFAALFGAVFAFAALFAAGFAAALEVVALTGGKAAFNSAARRVLSAPE